MARGSSLEIALMRRRHYRLGPGASARMLLAIAISLSLTFGVGMPH
jgi:hypothetical protein